jgi:hypothetical protein
MSVFEPNQDYTNGTNPDNLYETVMQVQQLLQDITDLLQMQEESPFQMNTDLQSEGKK